MTEFFNILKSCPTAYHTVDTVRKQLISAGYTEISESDIYAFSDGGKHFVIRNGSSVIAFHGREKNGFMICASHGDSPTFKLVTTDEKISAYARLSVERYGGMIYYSWLDRPLSVAGRVTVRTSDGVESRLVDIDKDILVIPSVAIHLNRTVNDGYKFNPAVDLLPLSGTASSAGEIIRLVALSAGCEPDDILSHDLYLYNREDGRLIGAKNEFVLAPRLDDLACVDSSLVAFLNAKDTDSVAVLAVFDNEEVGSETKQGAASTFLCDTLRKIAGEPDAYSKMLCNSFMISADNAHARHPNHPELSSDDNAPILGGGVAVKYNANQRYTTDAVSDGVLRVIAEQRGLSLQRYSNRADILGGSTLGSIADTRVSIPTVDIGIPQLAMHSASELIAVKDLGDMGALLSQFYSSSISVLGDKITVKK